MRAAGVGSMPGSDYAQALRIVIEETPHLIALPELPNRGAESTMMGRALGMLEGIGADIAQGYWRIVDRPGRDQLRAERLLREDLEFAEEQLHDFSGEVKVAVCGPLTLAAVTNLPRGDRVLADLGALRDLAGSLSAGFTNYLKRVRRALPDAKVIVQVDEPGMQGVLGGMIPTSSKFSVYPPVDIQLARELLALFAADVVHTCTPSVPVPLLVEVGVSAISFDMNLATPDDFWAEAIEGGVAIWPGIVQVGDDRHPDQYADSVRAFFGQLGFASVPKSTVITPTCGLAGFSELQAARALQTATKTVGAIT